MIKIIIIVTIAITIALAIYSNHVSFDNKGIEGMIDKIMNYLGIVAIPLVIWYLGDKKNQEEKDRIKEENLKKEQEEIEEKLKKEQKEIEEYKKQIVLCIKQSIINYETLKGYGYYTWRDVFNNKGPINRAFNQALNEEVSPNLITLMAKLDILEFYSTQNYLFKNIPEYQNYTADQKKVYEKFKQSLVDIINDIEQGNYDSKIKIFIQK